ADSRKAGGTEAMAQSTFVGQHSESVKASGLENESSSSRGARVKRRNGLTLDRHYTEAGSDGFDGVDSVRRQSVITNPAGSVVFKMEGAEVPASWSQLATDIVVSKYFRKAGLHGDNCLGETSVRQVVHRIAHTIRVAGEDFGGYFASKRDA